MAAILTIICRLVIPLEKSKEVMASTYTGTTPSSLTPCFTTANNMLGLSFILLLIVASLLALAMNVLIFKMKGVLKKEGHQVTWFYGHFFDLILFFKLYLKTRKNEYLVWLLLLCFLIPGFILTCIQLLKFE